MKERTKLIQVFLIPLIILFSERAELFSSQKYYLHSLVQQTMTPDIEGAIRFWVDFLYEENDSLQRTYWNKEEVEQFGDDYCLFCTSFFYQAGRVATLEFLPPYILYVEERDEQFIITTMFMEHTFSLSDSSIKNQSPWGIIKSIVEKHNNTFALKNVLIEETKLWHRLQIGVINYCIEPTVKIDTAACIEANQYIDSISNIWYGENYHKKIEYYIAPTSAGVNRLVGFDFGFLGGIGSGYTCKNANMILSGNKNFDYKHELTHLILPHITNHLLSEGLATYFGGTVNLDFTSAITEFSQKNYPITQEKISGFFDYPGFFDFYVFSALLCEQVYKAKGIEGLKSLLKDIHKMDDFHKESDITLQRICKLLNVTEVELVKSLNDRIKPK
jgi:hypothetical protein